MAPRLVDKTYEGASPTVVLRFAIPPDDLALSLLRPNQVIHIRATLTNFVMTARLPTVEFNQLIVVPK